MELRVLGPVELVDRSAAIHLAPVQRTVLAALASRAGERVGIDVLEEAVWPGNPPPTARKTLQGHIARLRRALGPTAIVERSGGYLLEPAAVEVDARVITQLLADARQAIASGQASEVVDVLRESTQAFRGEPYADVPEAALPAGEVQRLHELRAGVIEEQFEAELAGGAGERCIGELEAFVQAHPYRERAWGQLMLALYQAGRPADALAAYGRVRLVLAAELGLEPGPALRDLERSILAHDAQLRQGGSVRAALARSNVPAALNPIVGRARELAAVDELCADHRLVTLVGTGGIGKTTLAVEVAGQTAGRYESGPYFVDLAPLGDVGQVPGALVSALGVDVEPDDDVMERLRDALADRSTVLLIDNCEHLLPGIAELVAGLLGSNPGIRVLATSREPLQVAGEQVWPLDPLDVPPPSSSPEEIRASASGVLFISRLPVNVATHVSSVEDVAAVGVICRNLEGLPLALELAAARSRTLSLPDLADRLGRSISELARPGHGVLPRHRTMRAALAWGHELLSPAGQTALLAMSVFAGGCDLAAFTAVCVDDDADQALEVVDELVRTSFVVVDHSTSPTRYRLLEPVRQFARELLDVSGQRADRRRRHLEYYAVVARALHDGEDESGIVPLDELLGELGNLRVALDWAAEAPEETDVGLWLAGDMYYVWAASAHHAEGLARLEGLLHTGRGSPDGRSRAARNAAIIAAHAGHGDRSFALAEQALDEVRGARSAQERRARQVLALCLRDRGDVEGARRTLAPALPAGFEQATDVDAFCLVTQVELDLVVGVLDEAEATARRVLAGAFGSLPWLGPGVRFLLGEIMKERGDLELARSWFTEALALSEAIGDSRSAVDAHLALVFTECAAGRTDVAEDELRAAARLTPVHTRTGDIEFLEADAALALSGDSPRHAVGLAEAALARANEIPSADHQCVCLRLLGDARWATGDLAEALSAFEQLIARAEPIPYLCRLAEGHEGAAAANIALGHRRAASGHLAKAAEIRGRTGSQRHGRSALDGLAASLVATEPVDNDSD